MLGVYNVYCQAMLQNNSALLQVPQKMTSMHGRLYALVQNVSGLQPNRSPMRVVKYSTFAVLWHKHYKHIKIQQSCSDLCDICDKTSVELCHTLSEETRKQLNAKYLQHTRNAKLLRDHNNSNITKTEQQWKALGAEQRLNILSRLRPGRPSLMSGPIPTAFSMQYSFDYCQQLTIPYSSQQRGTIYFCIPRKVHVFGVC